MNEYRPNENSGYCHCGCGELAPVAPNNNRRAGWRKGKSLRYVRGHATRGKKLPDTSGKRSAASTGRRHSEESKRKIALALTGNDHGNATRGERNGMYGRSGPLSPTWNGGRSTERQTWAASREAQDWRISVFERDDYTCQECDQRGGDLHAHHIKPWATHPDLRCEIDNGQTLCVPCHRLTESYGRPAKAAA